MNPQLLALHDIHPAPPPDWWPPAPGWWLLGLVLLAALAAALRQLIRLARRRRQRHRALRLLQQLQRQSGGDPRTLSAGVSTLLRRAALARFPRQQVAALSGVDWLRFLDRTGATDRFSNGPGRVLAEAPFRPGATFETQALVSLARRWLRRNL